jgi:tetratricopeptide (TPR) repeat protein
MLRRIMGEFKRRLGIPQEIPNRPDALRTAFGLWLRLAAARARVVLILDALDRLEDRDGAPDLVWLPSEIPATVRLLVSTLPGRALDALAKRGWSELRVEPLSSDERRSMMTQYLGQYGKTLNPARTEAIVTSARTANPLFLRTLTDELRLFGIPERLDERIRGYLAATSVSALQEKVLQRYEEDYECDRPRLVGEAMSLIWASRRGLSEAELLELLGTDGMPLPSAHWSPLYLAAESSLVNRSGLLAFSHDDMREAVERRYLADAGATEKAHERLADYFESRSPGTRRNEELPWQLERAGAWDRLHGVLGDVALLATLPAFDTMRYWERLRTHKSVRIAETYARLIARPDENFEAATNAVDLMFHGGEREDALALTLRLGSHLRATKDFRLPFFSMFAADVLRGVGKFDEAQSLLADVERIARGAGLDWLLAASLHKQGVLLFRRGDRDGAAHLYHEAETLWREEGDELARVGALLDRGNLATDAGDLDAASAFFDEAESLSRFLGDEGTALRVLGGRGVLFRRRGELQKALAIYGQREELARRLGDQEELSNTFGDKGNALRDLGRVDEALAEYQRQETLCRALFARLGLARCRRNQAFAFCDKGDLEQELTALEEVGHIYRDVNNPRALAESLEQQALIRRAQGDLAKARSLLAEALQLCSSSGQPSPWAEGYQAEIQAQATGRGAGYWTKPLTQIQTNIRTVKYPNSAGKIGDALGAAKTREQQCRASGDMAGVVAALTAQGEILVARDDLAEAARVLLMAAQLARGLGALAALANCLNLRSTILESQGDFGGALLAHREQENIVRSVGSASALIVNLNNQAMLLEELQQPAQAAVVYEETVRLARTLADGAPGNREPLLLLSRGLYNLGRVLEIVRKLRRALTTYEEFVDVSRRLGDRENVRYALAARFKILQHLGDQQAPRVLDELRREMSG